MKLVRWLTAVVVLGALGAAAFHWWPDRRAVAPVAQAGPAVTSTALVKQTLSNTESLAGTIGYGVARPVTAPGAGVITWLPRPGAVVKLGQQLYRMDDRPVPLFYGAMPLYRPLRTKNTTGRDVKIVADNLRAIGYDVGWDAGTDEAVLTTAMIDGVKRWQTDMGMTASGSLTPGDVVVQEGAVRVDSVTVQPGAAAGTAILSVTSTDKVIIVEAEPAQAATVRPGAKVIVDVAGVGSVAGRVTAVGTQLKADPDAQNQQPPKLAISVTVNDPKKIERFDGGDVSVAFAGKTVKDALVAPLSALVALSEGGYAVQVESGALVPVKTGMFAKGVVQVSGPGLDEGVKVVTAA